MLLQIETTHRPATDIGYLLHKNPAHLQTFPLSCGRVHVFYPVASEERCRVAVLLDVDPVGLVRNRRGPSGNRRSLDQYVNDRPYVASSFMSVALNALFSTAMNGRSKERPELVETPLPLRATLSVVPVRGGDDLLERLFAPLGYQLKAQRHTLDEQFPEWGDGHYYTVTLSQTITLRQLLRHLYVLIPVLDNDKHYWVGDDEVDKLLARSRDWLPEHPSKQQIADRYLKYRRRLTRDALAQLAGEDDPDPDATGAQRDHEEEQIERPLSLNEQRLGAVLGALKGSGATRVLDLGCGEGNLLRDLLRERQFTHIVGVDVSIRALSRAADRLKLDRLPEKQRQRITLRQGALTYRDAGLAGFDAAAVVEVIEHLDPPRLRAFERALFETARPGTVVLTTPNREYNVRWPALPAGTMRHRDHRFEWDRAEFRAWAARTAGAFKYAVRFVPIGDDDPEVGPPTQMAIFTRIDEAGEVPA